MNGIPKATPVDVARSVRLVRVTDPATGLHRVSSVATLANQRHVPVSAIYRAIEAGELSTVTAAVSSPAGTRSTPPLPAPVGPARLVRVDDPEWTHAAGGRITYRVFLGDRWVGWCGDGRDWDGSRFAGRRWWVCWRQDGDTAARWDSGLTAPTRADALTALVQRATAGDVTGGRS